MFEDLMIHDLTIGRLLSSTDVDDSSYPVSGWQTLYTTKGYITVRRTDKEMFGSQPSNIVGYRIYTMPTDVNGTKMEITEGMEIVNKVPFVYATDKNLPRYKVIRVSEPRNHHFELECERRVATI